MITKYSINLENIDTELEKPEFKLLMNEGWEVVTSVPVIDDNTPTLIMVLKKKESSNEIMKEILDQMKSVNKHQMIINSILFFMIMYNLFLVVYHT